MFKFIAEAFNMALAICQTNSSGSSSPSPSNDNANTNSNLLSSLQTMDSNLFRVAISLVCGTIATQSLRPVRPKHLSAIEYLKKKWHITPLQNINHDTPAPRIKDTKDNYKCSSSLTLLKRMVLGRLQDSPPRAHRLLLEWHTGFALLIACGIPLHWLNARLPWHNTGVTNIFTGAIAHLTFPMLDLLPITIPLQVLHPTTKLRKPRPTHISLPPPDAPRSGLENAPSFVPPTWVPVPLLPSHIQPAETTSSRMDYHATLQLLQQTIRARYAEADAVNPPKFERVSYPDAPDYFLHYEYAQAANNIRSFAEYCVVREWTPAHGRKRLHECVWGRIANGESEALLFSHMVNQWCRNMVRERWEDSEAEEKKMTRVDSHQELILQHQVDTATAQAQQLQRHRVPAPPGIPGQARGYHQLADYPPLPVQYAAPPNLHAYPIPPVDHRSSLPPSYHQPLIMSDHHHRAAAGAQQYQIHYGGNDRGFPSIVQQQYRPYVAYQPHLAAAAAPVPVPVGYERTSQAGNPEALNDSSLQAEMQQRPKTTLSVRDGEEEPFHEAGNCDLS